MPDNERQGIFIMKKIPQFLFRCSLCAFVPLAANAAGTYYTGNYQSPQTRYAQQTYAQRTGTNARYSAPSYSSTRYQQTNRTVGTNVSQQQVQSNRKTANTVKNGKQGFYLNGGISRETAMWQFEMKESGSILHYDNVGWNVLDINAGYGFNLGKTALQVDAGFKYGMQSGETTMVDDDVTNGGYLVTQWIDTDNNLIGDQIGHALSIGTSQGGNMMGFNIGVGLTDAFKLGNVKFTPSVGFRYFKYKLETEKNYGLSVDTSACFQIDGSDEIQCDPAIIIHYDNGTQQIIWRDSVTGKMEVGTGAATVDTGGTYYYQQPGVSHSYEVEWSGPYVALDMDYYINQYNSVNGHVELGFPGYTATGDQPYRFDWQHPKSVEDSAGMFSAFHLGLGANWTTAITDSVSLSVGLTYDYYTVSDADAKTYLNQSYYDDIYNELLKQWQDAGKTESDMLDPETGDPIALNIKDLEASCPGGVCSSNGEIESFYKSMGIRVGLNARF